MADDTPPEGDEMVVLSTSSGRRHTSDELLGLHTNDFRALQEHELQLVRTRRERRSTRASDLTNAYELQKDFDAAFADDDPVLVRFDVQGALTYCYLVDRDNNIHFGASACSVEDIRRMSATRRGVVAAKKEVYLEDQADRWFAQMVEEFLGEPEHEYFTKIRNLYLADPANEPTRIRVHMRKARAGLNTHMNSPLMKEQFRMHMEAAEETWTQREDELYESMGPLMESQPTGRNTSLRRALAMPAAAVYVEAVSGHESLSATMSE